MRLTIRAVTFSILLLAMMNMAFPATAAKASASENVVHTSSPPLNLELALTFQPKIGDVLLPVKFALDQNGNISVSPAPWEIDTPIGVVGLSTRLSVPLLPQMSAQAKQASLSADCLLLIVRHHHGTILEDSNYQICASQSIQGIDIKGTIHEVSIKFTGVHFVVFIDASGGDISSFTLQGVSTGTTATAKIGCPSSMMVAWSMNINQDTLKEASGSPCAFQWTSPGGADPQCPIGYGSVSVQLNFPWWHVWDGGETLTCDGTHATTIDDMAVAVSATITFRVDSKSTDSTTPSLPSVQMCKVTSQTGLNIRVAPTSQSALIAHYPSGTVLNFVQVVNGENVNGNSLWGLSEQGHYYWLGGTDHSNG